MKNERKGGWIQTYLGLQFWPLDPREEEVFIDDIAHALSMMCRYNGHCKTFYSVAEHCVYVSENVSPELALHGLLHDAAEAYISDLTRPVKQYIPEFKTIERNLERVIFQKFGLCSDFDQSEIKRVDNAILVDESDQLMGKKPELWTLPEKKLGIRIKGWDWQEARYQFLKRYLALTQKKSA